MPLIRSDRPSALRVNIERLEAEGYSRKQAIAIALRIRREAKKKKESDASKSR
jgi:uncharacterized protein YoaH (UPF0181 family)